MVSDTSLKETGYLHGASVIASGNSTLSERRQMRRVRFYGRDSGFKVALTGEELSTLSGIPGISLHRRGRYEFPEGTPIQGRVKAVLALFDCHSKETEHTYFSIGNIVNDITNPVHGERLEFCRKNFGQNRGKLAMEFAWVAKYWAWNQSVGWPWGFYKATAKAGRKAQEGYIRRWKAGGFTVRDAEADMRERKKAQGYEGKSSTWNFSTTESTKSSDTQYYVESGDVFMTADLSRNCIDLFTYADDEQGEEVEQKVGTIGTEDLPRIVAFGINVATPKDRQNYQCLLIQAEEEERLHRKD